MRATIFALALCTATACASESHCTPQEQTIFSCAISKSRKVVSLCATKVLSKKHGSLAYRFGEIGKIELEFPSTPKESLNQFRHAHYFRSQVDRTEISFSVGQYVYTVFDYFEGDNEPPHQGLSVVKQKDGRETLLQCAAAATAHLQKLEGLVPCDEDNALAFCK